MGAERYERLATEREPFLERARDCSKLTLPLVIRSDGDSSTTDYDTPYQSVGSRGVNNLASELLLSLFPSNVPFFRLLVSDSAFAKLGKDGPRVKKEVTTSLAQIEQTVLEEIEDKNLRPTIFETLKNLLIAGNALVFVQPDGNVRSYSMEDYVVHRDVEGNLVEIVLREVISQQVAESIGVTLPSDEASEDGDKNVEIFTCVDRKDGKYHTYQTVKGEVVKGTEEEHELDALPWLALRLTKVTGESYGRSYVGSHLGDLKSLEGLQKALVESAAIMAKVVFMVNPASTTRGKVLAKARNGDVINGNASDVSVLQANKSGDMSVAFEATRQLDRKLSYAFNLLDASLPTKGMTTATEINAIINSLEKVMAGTYAMLSSEYIRPLVQSIIRRLGQEGKIPELPKEVKLIISVGISTLGRNADLERITRFTQMGLQLFPEAFMRKVKVDDLIEDLGRAIGVKSSLIKSAEEMQMEAQQAMQAQQQQQQEQQAMMQEQQKGKLLEKVAPQLIQKMTEGGQDDG